LTVAAQADWLEKDLYALLGVAQDADEKTISRAYRKLARDLHPDTHPGDADATERFKDVTAAYDVIGDATKRAEYDEFRRAVANAGTGDQRGRGWREEGHAPWAGFGTGPQGDPAGWSTGASWSTGDGPSWETFDGNDYEELLSRVLGGGATGASRRVGSARRGHDLEAVLDLDFEDAIRGLTTELTLTGPDGSRTFKVRVPAGVDHGQRIRVAGKGGPGANGGPPGDLYAVVRVGPHPVFGRRGLDLTIDAPISWPEAVLGSEVTVPTLEGPPVRVRVPAGTPHGRTLRVRGRGVPTATGNGDLLVGIRVTVPEQLTDEQRQAVEEVAAAFRTT
jgi:molecular chaperone DnaJ